ncbi:MAG TPA: cell division protein FtsA [Verrucomicrobiae bacterium]|nr:cell division protein FtsA [Verrucomicrobiae bacterium]
MFDDSNIIVGLEIGTSKVCAVVGEVTAEGALNIIGLGQSRSRGVRKGEIVDTAQAEEDIRNAIVEAEQMADVEIRSVYLGVSGGHIRGFNNRGVHPVVSADREISQDDIDDVIKNAKAINLPAENNVVHAVRQHFFVDGQDGVQNPVGMLGSRLEVDMHVVHGNTNRLQNSIRLVKGLQLDVEEIVFNGLASSLALLSGEQKELGALVIDIGGGTTDFVVYSDGVIKHTGVLAVGGDHISNDLAFGLKVPLSRGEKLKLEHGSAIVDEAVKGQTVAITNELGLTLKTVNVEHLQRIMSLRLEEIFQLIAQDLENAGLFDYLRAGVFLCGGGARIPQITRLAEQILQMPVTPGQTNSVSGIKSALDQPEFVTAIGLAKFGSFKNRKREGKSGLKGIIGKFLQRS